MKTKQYRLVIRDSSVPKPLEFGFDTHEEALTFWRSMAGDKNWRMGQSAKIEFMPSRNERKVTDSFHKRFGQWRTAK